MCSHGKNVKFWRMHDWPDIVLAVLLRTKRKQPDIPAWLVQMHDDSLCVKASSEHLEYTHRLDDKARVCAQHHSLKTS